MYYIEASKRPMLLNLQYKKLIVTQQTSAIKHPQNRDTLHNVGPTFFYNKYITNGNKCKRSCMINNQIILFTFL